MVVVDDSDRSTRLIALDGVVAEVGINLQVVDSADYLAVLQKSRAEGEGLPHALVDQGLCVGLSFVINLHRAVLVDGQALTSAAIAVDCSVSDHNAGRAETVVVAVNGEDGVVIRSDRGNEVRDVRAELIVCESGTKCGCIGELDIGDVIGNAVILDLLDVKLGVSVRVGVLGRGRGIGIQGSGLCVAL